MWEKAKDIVGSDPGQLLVFTGWAVAALVLFWLHPVFLFPAMRFMCTLKQQDWKLFDITWQSWKECLIPIAVYVPAHLLLFG